MNALHALATGDAAFCHARVVSRDEAVLTVVSGSRYLSCKRAATCLVVPAPGDLVLVSESGHDAYVLAVLERAPDDAPLELLVEGHARLRVSGGRLELQADKGVAVATGESYVVNARVAHFSFEEAQLDCTHYIAQGHSSEQRWTEQREIAEQRWSAAIHERVDVLDRTCRVAGHDQLEARSASHRIEEDFSVNAGDVGFSARRRVAINADGQVELG